MLRRLAIRMLGVVAFGGLSVGCSSAPGTAGVPGSQEAGAGDAGRGGSSSSSSGGGGGSGSGPEGGSEGSAGSSGDSGGSSSSGGSSGSGSGATSDGGGAHDGAPDATLDSGISVGDAGVCVNQSVWLAPMNAARAAVDAGEPPLVCDPIAVEVALSYASKCNYLHNPNRNAEYKALGGAATGLGENIAAGAPTEKIQAAVQSWLSEQANYDHATNACSTLDATPPLECGHYTQIVWKSTTGVGCAHVSCTANSPFGTLGSGVWDYSVCDFSPPGNVVLQLPSGNLVPQSPY